MKIEREYLEKIGCSETALDFYSNTDPFAIIKNKDGLYDAVGCIPFHAKDDANLRDTLDQLAVDI